MSLSFGAPRRRRRPSLTPMVDVVFLLLVFFMLAAQIGRDAVLPMGTAGGGGYEGPPRLVAIAPDSLRLNGVPLPEAALAERLATLTDTRDAAIILRPEGGATLQRVLDIAAPLGEAGFTGLVLAE